MTHRTVPSAPLILRVHASEPLEPRTLLSATIDAHGVLGIDGSSKADLIHLSLAPDDERTLVVRVRGMTDRFALRHVAHVVIRGFSGDDRIEFDAANGVISRPSRIYGGAGHDTIIGGASRDRIYAGTGDDQVN